jgi:dipeptidyl aminopeptidase/acylaminoacyl peptidase
MKLAILAPLTLGLSLAAAPGARKAIPLRDFFRNPEKAGFALSEDGRHLAWLEPYRKRLNVFVRPVGGGRTRRVTGETARDLAGFFWKGDRILYAKDFGGDENYHLVSVGLDGKDLRDLTPGAKLTAQVVDDLPDDPRHLLVAHNRRDPQVFDVYRIDVETGEEQLVARNPGNITGWLTDHAGRLRAAVATDGVTTSLLFRDREQDPFRTLLTTSFKETVAPLFFTFDDQRLYVASNRGRDKTAIFEFDPATAQEGRLVYERPDVDVDSLSYSRKRKVLTTVRFTTWKEERAFLDPDTEAMFRKVEARLPGYEVEFTNPDRAEDKYIVVTSSDRTQGRRYLYDKTTGTLTFLAESAPWLKEADLAAMRPVSYQARDGLAIHGYLTLPRGAAAKGLPVVVNPHGGPWTRDSWGFNPEVQFLANRGYAVFQPNYRGSTGYGRAFWEAGFKQWGRSMQDDLTDGVRWLVQEGIADPRRIAIYGGSYGGYAALAGITFTPDLYRAAVDYVGVSNLFTFMTTIPPYWKPYLDMMHEMVGDPARDPELLRAASPVFHVDRIRTPLFIAQGANDPRVNKAESDQMVEALRKRGVAVEYLVKADEGHGFQNEENRLDFYRAMERFLRRNLDVPGGSSKPLRRVAPGRP